MRSKSGVTLVEVLVGFGLFTLIGLLLVTSFTAASSVWRRVSGSTDSQTNLNRARDRVSREFRRTSFSVVSSTQGPASLGARDGDAVWCLSAIDPATGIFMRKSDGTPFWQRNILFYSVVPSNHSGLYGFTCAGGADATGYDDRCPHKVLIKKVIDSGVATDPTDETTEETLLTAGDVSGQYLSRPNGLDTSAMNGEAGVTEVALIAGSLLYFKVQLAPDPEWSREIRIDLRATAILAAQKELVIGAAALGDSHHTTQQLLSVFPGLP